MINNVRNYLTAFTDQGIAPMFAENEVDLDRIGEEPTIVFISAPSATGNRSSVVNTIFSQTLSALRSCSARHHGSCPVRTILVMDEFASMDRCERLLRDLGEIRKENIGAVLFWQSFNQLEATAHYTQEEARLILDLCKTKLILSCGDSHTAEDLSKLMGSYTAEVTSYNRSKSQTGGSSGSADSIIKRPLIDQSELTKWTPESGVILLHNGEVFALASRDITETFVSDMLGIEDEEKLYEGMEKHLKPRNLSQPRIWTGSPTVEAYDNDSSSISTLSYEPEGF